MSLSACLWVSPRGRLLGEVEEGADQAGLSSGEGGTTGVLPALGCGGHRHGRQEAGFTV